VRARVRHARVRRLSLIAARAVLRVKIDLAYKALDGLIPMRARKAPSPWSRARAIFRQHCLCVRKHANQMPQSA